MILNQVKVKGEERNFPLWGKNGKTAGKVVRKSGQKNADRLLGLLKDRPQATQSDMVAIVGINRSAIQRHLSNLKAAGRLLRIGPDKGGHWEVVD